MHTTPALARRYGWVLLALGIGGLTAARTVSAVESSDGVGLNALRAWIPDVATFSRLGEAVLRGDLDAAYADPFNQAGPLQILLDGLMGYLVAPLPDEGAIASVSFIIAIVPLLIAGYLATRLIDASGERVAQGAWLAPWLTVMVLGLVGADEENLLSGHWWQVPVLCLWAGAVFLTASDRPVAAGVLVGIAAGLEPWGVFGILAALVAPAAVSAARMLASSALVAALLWVPFAASGSFHIGDYQWTVRTDSLWSLLLGAQSNFPWGLRGLQAGLVLGLGAWSVWALIRPLRTERGSRWLSACLLFPVIIVLLRVSTDIWFGSYYLVSPAVLLLPTAIFWVLQRHRAGIWLGVAAWLVLVGASGIVPFPLSALAAGGVLVGLRTMRPPTVSAREYA